MPSEFVQRTWVTRAASAAQRRWAAAWRDWRHGPRRNTAELAFEWLLGEARQRVVAGRVIPCEDQVVAAILREFGESRLADRWSALLKAPSGPRGRSAVGLCVPEVARQAVADYSAGRRREADRAMEILRRAQRADGSWPEFLVPASHDAPGSLGAAAWFLTAQAAQIAATFAAEGAGHETIDAGDGRWQAVAEWLHGLPSPASIAEIGCGAGRFLSRIVEGRQFAVARLLGVDPSPQALCALPFPVYGVRGGWPRLPLAEASCDAVFTVESLEHTLVPRRAVAELCRVVRPGGRILIIDKHAAYRRLSHGQPWERWFANEEIVAWLAPECRDIDSRPIAHGPHRKPTGLFWCWTAVRK